MKIAVIDLGTNQFHLLIAELTPEKKFNILAKEDRFVRLGEGAINESFIIPAAVERAVTAMQDFKKIIDQYNCQKVGAVATSAVRNAKNGQAFIQRIAETTGIQVEIIDGDREAELIYEGIRNAISIPETSLIVDIGGGSVEFIICNSAEMFWKSSVEIGAQRLFYRFHTIDPIPAENVVALNQYLARVLQPLSKAVAIYKPQVIIGASGSFSTLYKLYAAMNQIHYQPDQSEYYLPIEEYYHVHKQLLLKNRIERGEMPGMKPERKDLIVTASCIVHFVVRLFNIQKIRVVNASLREGLLVWLAANHC
ncbi:MAG: exopolyphosphatase [Cytophagales bacterium]|nr:exopolyphosphatase [Bernardetiaceae bacterium]MDW8209729.1 exopolyphosphatase [Cytophagales bacterium]